MTENLNELTVFVDAGPLDPQVSVLVERAVHVALGQEGVGQAEISVAMLGDEAIRDLNRQHLGHDWITDVISFGLWGEGEPVVGDIYLGVDQAARQAEEERVQLPEELVRLTIHGVLHVLGWDHPDGEEARAASPMFQRQEELVLEVFAQVR
jgi:probable rRNA maturation factor